MVVIVISEIIVESALLLVRNNIITKETRNVARHSISLLLNSILVSNLDNSTLNKGIIEVKDIVVVFFILKS